MIEPILKAGTLNNQSLLNDYNEQINKKFTDITNNSQTLPYKTYLAVVLQTGSDNPVATVIENDVGNIVWTRVDPGGSIYKWRGTLTGAFTGKTVVLMNYKSPIDATNNNLLSLNGIAMSVAYTDYIELTCQTSGAPVAMPAGNQLVHLRIY